MDISRDEQRILHLLAQGGKILLEKDERKAITDIICLTRDGARYIACDLRLFRKLKQKKPSPHQAAVPTGSPGGVWHWCVQSWTTGKKKSAAWKHAAGFNPTGCPD